MSPVTGRVDGGPCLFNFAGASPARVFPHHMTLAHPFHPVKIMLLCTKADAMKTRQIFREGGLQKPCICSCIF